MFKMFSSYEYAHFMVSSTNKVVIGIFTRPNSGSETFFLQLKDFQKNKPHRFCACDSVFDYHPQDNSKNVALWEFCMGISSEVK